MTKKKRCLARIVHVVPAHEKRIPKSQVHFSGLIDYDGTRSEPLRERLTSTLSVVGKPHPLLDQEPGKLIEIGLVRLPVVVRKAAIA